MAFFENPPFARGQTLYNGQTIDANNLQGVGLLGQQYIHMDKDFSTVPAAERSQRHVHVRIVRNTSGAAVLPKRLVQLDALGQNATGYANTNPQRGYPVDEFLPTAGVVNNDVFFVVVGGPAMCSTALPADVTNSIAAGDPVVAATAVTSGATTAGRVADIDYTGATANLAKQILYHVGVAISAKTTANTAADILVDVRGYA